MKYRHFEALRPICPVCMMRGLPDCPVKVGHRTRGDDETLEEGSLHCTHPACQCEFPVIDGIPLLVPQGRSYVANNIFQLMARDDLSETVESLLGDGCGPGTAFDATRQHLSSYTWDHYGEFDPQEPEALPRPGSVVSVLKHGLALAGDAPSSILDVGCGVGRSSFELARQGNELVLGIDTHFAMLRVAARVLRESKVRYPRRRAGLVYERREFPVSFGESANVDFWACDACALPFRDRTFGTVVGLNVLDCVSSPLDMLRAAARSLRPGGPLILSTPYDWTGAVTAPEAWIGGHSQRSATGGASEPILRSLLTPGAHPASVSGIQFESEAEALPWHVRLHDRSVMTYRVHLVTARATEQERSATAAG